MSTASPSESTNPIRVQREKAGMSREELAFKAGLSFKTIERLEAANGRKPHWATRVVLADALGCDPEELNGGEAAA